MVWLLLDGRSVLSRSACGPVTVSHRLGLSVDPVYNLYSILLRAALNFGWEYHGDGKTALSKMNG